MLSMLMVIGFASCSKNLVQRTPLEELDGTLTVKVQAAKKQEAGPGLVFVEGGTFTMGVQDDVMHD
jgi:formylglycine-generating enzyme required for sulfatase activity